MTFWLGALVIWMAAGARVGRVLVKPATTARLAIVLAVASVAAAATAAIPEVAVTVDHLLPGGVDGRPLAERVVAAAWLMFAVATSVVAAAAWPIVSRRNLRKIAASIYAAGLAAVVVTVGWSVLFGWAVTLPACGFVAITGLRNLDWTALGRGIALYTSGTVVVGVLAALSIRRLARDEPPARPGTPGWFWPAWQVAGLFVALGAVWIVIELWARARLLLRRIRVLHRTLIGRFPEVVTGDKPASTAQLRASDHVTQIMDAMYLQSGGGVELVAVGPPPASVAERADLVARWARDPSGGVAVDARWIAPPEGVGPRGWVRAIARAYRTTPAEGSR